MKISDEELKTLTKIVKLRNGKYAELILTALKELRQLREERRWRDIEDLKIINNAVYEFVCPQCENKSSHLFYSTNNEWESVESNYIYSTEKMKEQGYVKGRLLPMDLPEVE